tara:strand:+ start:132 stop:749 length:618 start_codon:yes stop_codon:yes gene_type:complete
MTAKIKLNAASGGGSFSLQAPSSSSNNRVFTLPDVADGTIATTANAGKILQVVQATKTDTESFTVATQTVHQYTPLSVSITPSATSSKILVILHLSLSNPAEEKIHYGVQRTIGGSGATSIGIGDAAGSRKRFGGGQYTYSNPATTVNYSFLDSPSTTSACVYYPILGHDSSGTKTFNINRSNGDSDSGQNARYMSSIIVQEVGA